MKFILWNIYNGFQDGSKTELLPALQRKEHSLNWVRQQDADVVGLLELQDYKEADFISLFKGWNHQYGQLLKGVFPMGLSSRIPMGNTIHHTVNMSHGLIACELGPITLMLTHIPPKKYTNRSVELRVLLKSILPILQHNRPLILMGDFNASAQDPLLIALQAIGLHPLITSQICEQVFVSDSLLPITQATIEWEEGLERLSDHLPIQIEIDLH